MLVLYFSGTGNTKFIAKEFAYKMKALCYSIEEKEDFSTLMKQHQKVAFCYPIYCSGVPRLMREFAIKHRDEIRGKQVIIFCTQVLYSGDGARAFTDLFQKDWFHVIYAEHFFMPNNLCNVLPKWTFSDFVIKWEFYIANRKLNRITKHIKNNRIWKRGFHKTSMKMGMLQRKYQLKAEEKAKNSVKVGDNCVACGICVRNCPVNNFHIENKKAVPLGHCMFCYRCVNICPQKAVTVVYDTPIEKQYKGMEHLRSHN